MILLILLFLVLLFLFPKTALVLIFVCILFFFIFGLLIENVAILKGGSVTPNINFKNIFYYLQIYKKALIDILSKNSVDQHKARRDYEGVFIKWYLSNIDEEGHYFVPKRNILTKSDVIYMSKSNALRISYEDILRQTENVYNNLLENSKVAVKQYQYRDIFSNKQKERLRALYKGPEDKFEYYRNKLSELYYFLGGFSNQLSVPLIFSGVELFGSPINTNNPYCSPFAIEKHFSSLGSFFEYEIRDNIDGNIFLANPPFDEDIMERMSSRLLEQLYENAKILVLVVIPVWDPESQKKYNLKLGNKEFRAYDILKNSNYLKEQYFLPKFEYLYYNYYNNKYIPASNSHLLILSNYDHVFATKDFLKKWRESSKKSEKYTV